MTKTAKGTIRLPYDHLNAYDAFEVMAPEPEEAPQNRSSTLESCVKSTSNISRICTMSSLISKKPLTEYGMQPYGPPCGSTISVQI